MTLRIGRLLFALGMGALGVLSLLHHDFILEWSAVPDTGVPMRDTLALTQGAVLLVAGLGLLFVRTERVAALVLAALWALYAALHVPLVVSNWKLGLGGLAESSALVCIALLLSANDLLARIGRYGFGLCMIPFGIVHFLYPDAVANWIPHWIPGPGAWWANATGAAHVAAGLAVLSGVLAPLASRLVVLMYGSWLILLHIPRVIAALQDRHEWTTLFVAVAFNGGAWVLMNYLTRLKT
ncbi:MAG: DoxX family membrane protein [Pseudomonadota bacterium]